MDQSLKFSTLVFAQFNTCMFAHAAQYITMSADSAI
jgi:hypothetical protein